MEIDKNTSVPGRSSPEEVIDRLIERVTEWIKIAPVEYSEEWAELQTRMRKREERIARAAKRKGKRLNQSAFRKKP